MRRTAKLTLTCGTNDSGFVFLIVYCGKISVAQIMAAAAKARHISISKGIILRILNAVFQAILMMVLKRDTKAIFADHNVLCLVFLGLLSPQNETNMVAFSGASFGSIVDSFFEIVGVTLESSDLYKNVW